MNPSRKKRPYAPKLELPTPAPTPAPTPQGTPAPTVTTSNTNLQDGTGTQNEIQKLQMLFCSFSYFSMFDV